MVTVFVVETGLSENSSNNHSAIWEDAIMDVFFEAGHIVSNAPILRLDLKPRGDILETFAVELEEGRRFGIDFALIAILEFSPDAQSVNEISFYIYRLNSGERIYERQIPARENRSFDLNEIKAIARGLVPFVRQ